MKVFNGKLSITLKTFIFSDKKICQPSYSRFEALLNKWAL